MVQSKGQLDHAQASAKVTTGDRHSINHGVANFASQLGELLSLEKPHVCRGVDRIQERSFAHGLLPSKASVAF
jgi:hypothetical protein